MLNISRRTALLGMGIAGLTVAAQDILNQGSIANVPDSTGEGLRARADRKGLLIGAMVRASTLRDDPRIGVALRDDANIVVPEYELKWDALEPEKDKFDFSAAEPIYAFAAQNKIRMRGHTLTWYRSIPQWARAAIPAMSPAAAGDMLEKYVKTVVGHWKGRIVQWDVANEAIDGRRLLSEPLWSNKLGEQYLDIAFKAAHAADPKAMLVFNTDLIEMDDPYQEQHRNATLELLERLLKRGVPVHALGIESHLQAAMRFSPTVYRGFLDKVTAMGLKIVLTEFDIGDKGILGTVAARDASVAALGKAFLDVSFTYPQCLGMLTWSPVDKYSWLRTEPDQQRFDGAPLRPGLLDDDFQRKLLWGAVAAAIDGAPAR